MDEEFDVVVIGAGVVGCAVARDFSRFDLGAALLEAASDLGEGASKGNTAWLCSGWDTAAGTIERACVVRGYERYRDEAPELGLPNWPCGHLVTARTPDEAERLAIDVDTARKAGFENVRLLDAAEAYERLPALGPGLEAAIWAPDDGIIDPFSVPVAYALDAVANGVTYRADCPVTATRLVDGLWHLAVPNGTVAARLVINCAGLYGDALDRLAGFDDFVIQPRRGQYILFDKSAAPLCDRIVSTVPSSMGRGIGVQPTIFGNVLLGPTAEEVDDPEDRRTTPEGLAALLAGARVQIPELLDHPVTTSWAGMRPASEDPDYRIIPRPADRWISVGGIRSTGLSGALGIAEHVVNSAIPSMIDASRKDRIVPVRVPSLAEQGARPWADDQTIAADPAHGEMLCHCERITLGEVMAVLDSPLPPVGLKALKRRTRVMMGRCQGFFCDARVRGLLGQAQNQERARL